MIQLSLAFHDGCPGTPFVRVPKCEPMARDLADAHYSRQTPGARDFLPPGQALVLVAPGAVWGVCANLDPAGRPRWRVTIFRNEGPWRSSELIEMATPLTYDWWRSHYGGLPPVLLTTEVDPAKVRHKRDPGRCFLRAGWRYADGKKGGRPVLRNGLVVLVAAGLRREASEILRAPCLCAHEAHVGRACRRPLCGCAEYAPRAVT